VERVLGSSARQRPGPQGFLDYVAALHHDAGQARLECRVGQEFIDLGLAETS
jgi:hypothetical protein